MVKSKMADTVFPRGVRHLKFHRRVDPGHEVPKKGRDEDNYSEGYIFVVIESRRNAKVYFIPVSM